MLIALLTLAVFATSVLSGILGMAGGMVLMAILVSTLGVAGAMMLHGAAQTTANGSRAWFLRRHIQWQLFPPYLLGAGGALVLFIWLTLVPDPSVVLILVGLFPWLARFSKRFGGLDITHPPTAVVCGFSVTCAQLLAGASGPLLDTFYVKAPLARHAIVASKAITQTLGHILKIIYYGLIINVATQLPLWWFGMVVLAAIVGTRVGTRLLDRWNDASFRRYSQAVILALASACIVQGVWVLLS